MILTLTAHHGPHPVGNWAETGTTAAPVPDYSPRPPSALTTPATAADT